jgi:hypothetical protein
MSLNGILSAGLPDVASMKLLSGKRRSRGANTKEEAMYSVLLALVDREDAGIAALPVETQQKVSASPVATRELKRISMASSVCTNWVQLRSVLERFPPSILIQILQEEMSAAQMKSMGGKARCEGAKSKDELVFAVLLGLADRGAKALRDLPATAQSRIQSAPNALDWLKMMERANPEVLKQHGTWQTFLELLCSPREGLGDADDDDDGSGSSEDEVGDKEKEEAAAKVAELESQLAHAKAALSTATRGSKKMAVGNIEGASSTMRRLDFGEPNVTGVATHAAATKPPRSLAQARGGALVARPAPLWVSLAEVVLTFAMPVLLVLLVCSPSFGGTLPGRPGDDTRLHRLAN